MKKSFPLMVLCVFVTVNIFAQQTALQPKEDSILKLISTSTDVSITCNGYLDIAKIYTGQNMSKESEYINKTIFKIEQSRDRKLIANYYRRVADQWNSFDTPERSELAFKAIDKGLLVSKEAQLNKETALLLVRRAITNRIRGNITEAIKSNEESIGYASLSKNDSAEIVCAISHANTLMAKDENLSAFKKYMYALNLAEIAKDEKSELPYLYKRIADFYVKVGQVEKGKDYYMKGLGISKKIKDSITELSVYQSMISVYCAAKDFSSAREYLKILYQKQKTSSFYNLYAVSAESSIIAQEDINKLPEFIRQNKTILLEYEKYGMLAELYRLKGVIFTVELKFDSALYYLTLSKKQLNPNNLGAVLNWNQSYAYYLEKNKKYMDAAKYIDENVLLAKKTQSITFEKECYEYLDSLYIKEGNKEKEVYNKLMLYNIKDSLNKQQKANDLLGVEIDIENKRNEREAQEKEQKLTRRNNLQYMGITSAIIFLFIALAAMGKFKVKPWLIRAIGFLSFILLFEFIILLIDHQIHALTHGEPLPILLTKIVIIAFLLPFHHWLEHKVIHFLMRNTVTMNTQIER
jgi:hypothetical protein